MAQIAIPILLLGTAYLISNDKNNDEQEQTEGFAEINDIKTQGNLLANENKTFYPNISPTKNNINNEIQISQYQDKYYLNPINDIKEGENEYETLAGNTIKLSDLKHNNMNLFYSNKSNGGNLNLSSSILDNHTGQGTYDIKKEEVASFFKPEDNMQNVYGNQNNNDFFQSRVNESHRHANTKPWEEIRDTPGIGMDYNSQSSQGFNNSMVNRELYTPKNVDQLRASNNPKLVYKLDNHMGPAINPVTNRGIQGKIVKKGPDSYFVNNNNLGMVASSTGMFKPKSDSEQMLTNENRATTSVEYYGVKGSEHNHNTYVNGEYQTPHKQQLDANPMINMSNNNVNPTNSLNYGKDSFNVLPNNRTTTKDSYFGNISGILQNVVEPIVNGLRHSKKTNCITNPNQYGNFNGGHKQPTSFNPNEHTSTTNREMYENKLSMNHLNVQKQDGTAYMNTRPILMETQRSTLNQSETGPAMSNIKGNRNYDFVTSNQQNINKLYAKDITPNGNMALFNDKINIIETNKEICNNRQTPFYNPTNISFDSASHLIGQSTSSPQQFESLSNRHTENYLVKAFKENPYTKSLNSVA
jgi:hypothetical protein